MGGVVAKNKDGSIEETNKDGKRRSKEKELESVAKTRGERERSKKIRMRGRCSKKIRVRGRCSKKIRVRKEKDSLAKM